MSKIQPPTITTSKRVSRSKRKSPKPLIFVAPNRDRQMQLASTGRCAEMAKALFALSTFQFSDVEAKAGYHQAMKEYCQLKRQGIQALYQCEFLST